MRPPAMATAPSRMTRLSASMVSTASAASNRFTELNSILLDFPIAGPSGQGSGDFAEQTAPALDDRGRMPGHLQRLPHGGTDRVVNRNAGFALELLDDRSAAEI